MKGEKKETYNEEPLPLLKGNNTSVMHWSAMSDQEGLYGFCMQTPFDIRQTFSKCLLENLLEAHSAMASNLHPIRS